MLCVFIFLFVAIYHGKFQAYTKTDSYNKPPLQKFIFNLSSTSFGKKQSGKYRKSAKPGGNSKPWQGQTYFLGYPGLLLLQRIPA